MYSPSHAYLPNCLQALDSALMNSAPNCEKFIELGGLKAVFPLYMGRGWGTALKGKRQGERDALTEQVVSLVASMCMLLGDSQSGGGGGNEAEARLVSKFLEGQGEKVDRAVELFTKFASKVEEAREEVAQGEEQWAAEVNRKLAGYNLCVS